ncbi:MAG TPA: sugar transferase [Dehalococcoidia bacterium]|nr:sugar transferase [Dehalococcoidia bacterium]
MLRRAFDIALATPGLIFFLVTYPLIAVAIKVDSRGPVIYKQTRVGLRGRRFTIYKYRTMSHEGHKPYETPKLDHEHFRTFVFITPTSRLTRVGRFLRATSLDELPNFWNVLRGDMSIVGPRPEIPELVEQYPPEYHRRHEVKPGITGLAQINGRADLTYEETMKYDIEYIEKRSLALDLSIIAKTFTAVVSRKGAR